MTYSWYYALDSARREWIAAIANTTVPPETLPGTAIHVSIRGQSATPDRRTVASILHWSPARRGARISALLTPLPTAAALPWRYRRLPSGNYAITTFGPVNPDLQLLGIPVPVFTSRGAAHIRTITRVRERSYYRSGTRVVADILPDRALDRAELARAAREARAAHQSGSRPTATEAIAEADWRYIRLCTDTGPVWAAQAIGAFQRDAFDVLPGQIISVLSVYHNVHLRTIAKVLDVRPLPGRALATVALLPMDS